MSNICFIVRSVVFLMFECEICCVRDGLTIVWVILCHEYRWFQCWRHAHSPYHRMFIAIFCNIHWRSFLPFSHLIIHPIQEWSGSQRQIWFCFIVPNDELLCSSLRAMNGFHRSIIHQFITFPLLRRPSFIIVTFRVACRARAFNESVVVALLVTCVTPNNGFPRSNMFHSFFTKRTCFELLRTGCSSLRANNGVSPFYHDLGLDLVGLIGNFWFVEQLLPLVVEQLLKPTLSSSHVSRKSSEAVEVIHTPSCMWLLQFPFEQLSEYNKLGVFREEW